MRLEAKMATYLEYCEYRKELDKKTLKAYRIDLHQYFEFVCVDEPEKEKIEEYITHLHEYSCAVIPQVRQTGNRLSGLAGTAYASLLT